MICADVNAHDTAWNQTANPNTRDGYLVDVAINVDSTFLSDPDQPTRQDSVMDVFSSPDVMFVHAAFRDRYDW